MLNAILTAKFTAYPLFKLLHFLVVFKIRRTVGFDWSPWRPHEYFCWKRQSDSPSAYLGGHLLLLIRATLGPAWGAFCDFSYCQMLTAAAFFFFAILEPCMLGHSRLEREWLIQQCDRICGVMSCMWVRQSFCHEYQHVQVAGPCREADVPAHSFLCVPHLFSGGVCVSMRVWMCVHFAFCFLAFLLKRQQ